MGNIRGSVSGYHFKATYVPREMYEGKEWFRSNGYSEYIDSEGRVIDRSVFYRILGLSENEIKVVGAFFETTGGVSNDLLVQMRSEGSDIWNLYVKMYLKRNRYPVYGWKLVFGSRRQFMELLGCSDEEVRTATATQMVTIGEWVYDGMVVRRKQQAFEEITGIRILRREKKNINGKLRYVKVCQDKSGATGYLTGADMYGIVIACLVNSGKYSMGKSLREVGLYMHN